MTRDTAGKISTDLLHNAQILDHSAHEQMKEQLSDFEANIYESINEGKKKFDNDFYVVVIAKKERLMQNIIRNYFFTRISCPSPDWDQTVYKYDRSLEALAFLWVVPSKAVCKMFKNYALEIDRSERELLNFVLSFEDGTLLKLSKKLNGEEEKSLFLK